MRVYIIHSSDKEENYIDRTIQTEQKLIEEGHHVMNPLIDQHDNITNKFLHDMYGHQIRYCDEIYVMDGWSVNNIIGNAEFAEAIIHKKTIRFEQV